MSLFYILADLEDNEDLHLGRLLILLGVFGEKREYYDELVKKYQTA